MFCAKTFLSDCGEVFDIWIAAEVDTGLLDLGIPEFKADFEKRN